MSQTWDRLNRKAIAKEAGRREVQHDTAMYPIGTLLRVRDEALVNEALTEHGSIWVVCGSRAIAGREKHIAYRIVCKSLATGQSFTWFDHEVEKYDGA